MGPIIIKTFTVLVPLRVVRAMDVLARWTNIVPWGPSQTTFIYKTGQPRSIRPRKVAHGRAKEEEEKRTNQTPRTGIRQEIR